MRILCRGEGEGGSQTRRAPALNLSGGAAAARPAIITSLLLAAVAVVLLVLLEGRAGHLLGRRLGAGLAHHALLLLLLRVPLKG
jgi:hypothetical protein